MSEYIPKYPSQEGDDSNKSSSELLAETLKPIYVPQDLMLAWESHLASYSRDTNVLLDQVKDSELALNTQYQVLLTRVQKYEQMLQDITMDSNEFTMDTDEVNFTGWNILAQASYWDYLLRKEITKLSDQIKSAEYKGGLVTEVTDAVLEGLIADNTYISNVIGALSDTPLIRELDEALTSTTTSLAELQAEYVRLAEKQAADAEALAHQQVENAEQLVEAINASIAEQLDRIAQEAAIRTQLLQELEDRVNDASAQAEADVGVLTAQVDSIREGAAADKASILETVSGYRTELKADIATVNTELLEALDGVNTLVTEVRDENVVTLNELTTYKASNDVAVAGLVSKVSTNVSETAANASKITGLTADLATTNTELGKVRNTSANALSKANTAVTANSALATRVDALSAAITDLGEGAETTVDVYAFNALKAEVVTNSTGITSLVEQVDALGTSYTNLADGVEANTDAVSTLTVKQSEMNGDISQLSSDVTFLTSELGVTNTALNSKASNQALSNLNTKLETTDGKVAANTQQLTQLNSDLTTVKNGLETKASTEALNNLVTEVIELEDGLAVNASAITSLKGEIDTELNKKATVTAVNGLTTKVEEVEGKTTTNANSIIALNTSVGNVVNGLANKLDASAISDYYTKSQTDAKASEIAAGKVEEFSASIQSLVDANSTAIQNTNAEVIRVDERVTATNSAQTLLEGRVQTVEGDITKKADATALSSLDTRVGTVEGQYSSQASDITSLSNSLDTTNLNVGTAQTAAQDAMNAAGSKGKVIFGTTAPVAADRLSQNLWIDTTNNANTPKRWNGSAWVVVTDKVATDAAKAVKDLDATVKTKADVSALNSLTTKVGDEAGKITANTNSITTLNSDIVKINNDLATKANASALSDMYTKTQTDAKATEIAAGEVSKYDSSLVIGGNNLLSYTANYESSWTNGSQYPTSTVTVLANGEAEFVNTQNGWNQWQCDSRTNTGLATIEVGKTYTLSAEFMAMDEASAASCIPWLTIREQVTTSSTVNPISSAVSAGTLIANKWVKLSVTGVLTSEGTRLYWRAISGMSQIGTVRIRRIQLEEGTKATAWAPSVLDVEANLNANATAIENTNSEVSRVDGRVTTESGRITSLTGRVSTVEGGLTKKADATALNSYYTKVEADTAIAGQITAYKATVDNALGSKLNASAISNYYTSAQTDSKIESIASGKIEEFRSESGASSANVVINAGIRPDMGNPLSLGSIVDLSTEAAVSTTSGTAVKVDVSNAVSTYTIAVIAPAFRSISTTNNTYMACSEGDTITYEFEVFTTVSRNIRATFDCMDASNSNIGTVVGTPPQGTLNSRTVAANVWERCVGQMVVPAGVQAIRAVCRINTGAAGTVYVRNIRLYKESSSSVASASVLSNLDTKVTSIDGRVTTQASQLAVLTSDNNNNKNALSVQGKVINGVKANYMVKMETNGVIGGFGIIQEATGAMGTVTTTFGVNADNFFIGAPVGGKKPFIVTTTNQVVDGITYPAGTWINSAIIANATIGTAKIADLAVTGAKIANATIDNAKIASIDAAKINTGTLNAARIGAGSITAGKIQVDSLSAISANLGSIKVGSANIEALSVDAVHIKDRAVTVPIASQQTLSDATFSGSVAANWTKSIYAAFPGVETISPTNFCTLFFRSDVRFYSTANKAPLVMEIYLADVRIGSVASRVVVDGSVTMRVWVVTGVSGEYITMVTGVTEGAYIDEQGAIQVAFNMPYGINANSAIEIRLINKGGTRNVVVSGSYVNLYLVEFKK